MENEHFSVSRVTNWYIIIIVNSPGRSSIKFYTGKLCPGSNYLQIRYSFRTPISNGWGFEWLAAGILSAGGTQESFIRGSPAPRSMSIPFHIPCLTEKVLLSHTIPSLLAVKGWGGLLQAFYPQGVLKNVLYGEALLQGPCPYLSIYRFWQKRYSSRIPFHPFWRLRGGVACYRYFKISSDNTRVNGKKDCLIKIKLARYFAVSFFSNKIVLTLRNL